MSVLAEVDIRNGLREAFGASQKRASESVLQSSGAIFFNVETMLQGPELTFSRLRENVETFAAEHFFKATSRLAYFDGENWCHPDGELYNDFFDRAIEYYADSPDLVERFTAEKQGYINAGLIIKEQKELGNEMPAWVIASPPGRIYRNKAFATRNVTFIAIPICERAMTLQDGKEKIYQEYQMFVVPSKEIETSKHWQAVLEAGDLNKTLSILGIAESMIDADDANLVVSIPIPILLTQIETAANNLVSKFGYTDFVQVRQEAGKALELENDPLSFQRRKEMIEYFASEMWRYVSRRNELTDQEKLILKTVADVMHDYLSAEGGSEYVGMTFTEVKKMIEGHTLIHQRNSGVNFSQKMHYIDWAYAEAVYQDYFFRLQQNEITQERRNNAGCPVNMNQSLLESRLGGFETYTTSYGYESTMTDTFANIYTESTTTSGGEKECYQCPMPNCGADVYTKNGDTYCVKGHHKGG